MEKGQGGMSDDRSELLRTQTVHAILGALGAAQVNVYGKDPLAGGVFLDTPSQVTSRTYWGVDGRRYEYAVKVHVEVVRRPVS